MRIFRQAFGNENGYSLAELVVSAGVLLLTIFTLVVVLRKGGELSETGIHRERARAIIDSCLESPSYNYDNFVNLKGDTSSVLIDLRDGIDPNDDLVGTLLIDVRPDTNATRGQSWRDAVAFKEVTVRVTWAEPEALQTIVLTKQVTKL